MLSEWTATRIKEPHEVPLSEARQLWDGLACLFCKKVGFFHPCLILWGHQQRVSFYFSCKLIHTCNCCLMDLRWTHGGWRDGFVVKSTLSVLLKKTWVQFPPLTCWLITIHSCHSREHNVFFQPPWASGTYVVHIHTFKKYICIYIYIHEIK